MRRGGKIRRGVWVAKVSECGGKRVFERDTALGLGVTIVYQA